MKKYLPLFIIFLLLIPGAIFADVIYLKSGRKIEGIIEKKTDTAITITLDIGSVTYPKTQIESLSKSSDEENAKLKGKWKTQKQQRQAEQEEWRKFAEEQEAKGLIFYEGKWITKDEYERFTKPKIEEKEEKKIKYVLEPVITLPKKDKKSSSEDIKYKDLLGKTILRKLKSQPDQTYYLYLPQNYSRGQKWPLFIGIHGYKSNGAQTMPLWRTFADSEGFILVCPSFKDGYQRLEYASDYRMIDIIKELSGEFRIDDKKVFMAGFSGGAQFAHRFVLRHPEYVQAASIMAAGSYDYPTSSIQAKDIKFLVTVGENDSERFEITKKFAEQLKDNGYNVRFKSFPGVGHDLCDEAKKLTIDLFRQMSSKK